MKLIRIAKTTKPGYEQYDFHEYWRLPNGKWRLFDTSLPNPDYYIVQQNWPYIHLDVKPSQVYFKNKWILTKTERKALELARQAKRKVKDIEPFRNYDYYDYKFHKKFKIMNLTMFLLILMVLSVVLSIIIL